MTTRKILYLNPAIKDEGLRGGIHLAGWDLDIVCDLSDARDRMRKRDYRVGLARFDQLDATNWLETEAFFSAAQPTMEWVALTLPDLLENQHLRKLIYKTFYDYHTLPTDPAQLLSTLGHAYGMAALRNPDRSQDNKVGEYAMVGVSPAMRTMFRTIRKFAGVDAPVLIAGESGTGKELMAVAIHERSPRANGPFVAVNCGALPSNLIQTELFGHEKGAFTSAYQRRIGRIEAAAGGTIFLDEVGDLPLDLQVNLSRFLQEKTIERVGGTESIPVKVRVIAATHVDLERAVQEGRFREDLYFRLNVLRLQTPPLRERLGDAELLARFFFDEFSNEKSNRLKGFSQPALLAMNQYHWPGNVRELINRIRQAMVMCENRLITPQDLGLEEHRSPRFLMTLDKARAAAEKKAIQESLHYAKNNISQAARQLDVHRVTLYRLMKQHGIAIDSNH